MSKHFVISPSPNPLLKADILAIENGKATVVNKKAISKVSLNQQRINSQVDLKYTENRIVIKIDLDFKNSHTFENGQKIYIGRQFNNLNRRETEPVNAIVISAEDIPKNAEILIHPNSISDTNLIHDYESISEEQGNSVRYYSIETISAFLWRMGAEDWEPLKGFATAYRVFKPYEGIIQGILPTQIENVLYIRSGEYEGMVCHTLKAADYEIIFMNEKGVEQKIIRCRHYENEYHDREELIAVDHELTNKVKNGKLLIGLSPNDCNKLNLLQDA